MSGTATRCWLCPRQLHHPIQWAGQSTGVLARRPLLPAASTTHAAESSAAQWLLSANVRGSWLRVSMEMLQKVWQDPRPRLPLCSKTPMALYLKKAEVKEQGTPLRFGELNSFIVTGRGAGRGANRRPSRDTFLCPTPSALHLRKWAFPVLMGGQRSTLHGLGWTQSEVENWSWCSFSRLPWFSLSFIWWLILYVKRTAFLWRLVFLVVSPFVLLLFFHFILSLTFRNHLVSLKEDSDGKLRWIRGVEKSKVFA